MQPLNHDSSFAIFVKSIKDLSLRALAKIQIDDQLKFSSGLLHFVRNDDIFYIIFKNGKTRVMSEIYFLSIL